MRYGAEGLHGTVYVYIVRVFMVMCMRHCVEGFYGTVYELQYWGLYGTVYCGTN
jgi:hypothetical protein